MTVFQTPLSINEGSRATPGLWNRISDTHYANYNLLDDRIDTLSSNLSDILPVNAVYFPRAANRGIVFRKSPNPLSGSTWQIWADRQGTGVVIGNPSNVSKVFVGSNDMRFLGGDTIGSDNTQRARIRFQKAQGGTSIYALGTAGFGMGAFLDKVNRPYGCLNGTQGPVLNFSDYTLNYAYSRKPATSTSAGSAGDFSFTSQHVYFCVSESSWKRAALSGY